MTGQRAPQVAVLVGGPPATGKTTLGRAVAAALPAALLDLDTVTGPLSALVLQLLGATDLSDAGAAEATRAPRYDTLFAVAADSVRAGVSAVLVAPFTAERHAPAWAAVRARLAPAEVRLVWLTAPPDELARRLVGRAADRDAVKRRDPRAWLASLDPAPPTAPHLLLDATRPVGDLAAAVLADLATR